MGHGKGSLSRRHSLARLLDPGKTLMAALAGEPAGDAAPSVQNAWSEPVSSDQRALQLTRRITFGPRPGDLDRVRKMGPEAFLDQQLHPENLDDSDAEPRWSNLRTLSLTTEELMEDYPRPKKGQKRAARAANGGGQTSDSMSMQMESSRPQLPRRIVAELAQEEILRAVYSRRQLQEVMVQFWMNHFNIYAFKGPERWMLTSFERDTIRPHTLGKFEDLLVATAQSPAMLFYLDNWMSSSAKPNYPKRLERRRFGRRGFYAQEMMRGGSFERRRGKQAGKHRPHGINENYGRELMELHTLGVNGGYTQQDVIEVARCLTGWSINHPRRGGGFLFRPFLHDYGSKVVMGHKFHSGHGIEDGYKVLHLLAHHPSTAHHLAFQLSRGFVADQPPATLVDRARDTFLSSDGDIRAVLKTILTSPEFYSRAAYGAKVKSPMELTASALRALGAQTDAGRPLLAALARMGEPMFMYVAPTGYPDRADAWINSGSLLARINFSTLLAENRLRGTSVAWERWRLGSGGAQGDGAPLGEELLGEAPSARTRKAIRARLDSLGGQPRQELAAAAGLWLASPEFQRR